MNKGMKWVKEGFLEEVEVILELVLKDVQVFFKRKVKKDILDRREKKDKGGDL